MGKRHLGERRGVDRRRLPRCREKAPEFSGGRTLRGERRVPGCLVMIDSPEGGGPGRALLKQGGLHVSLDGVL